MYTMNLIVPDVKAGHFGALDDIYPKVARCLCISPSHPVMFRNAPTRLVSGTVNRIPDICADVDDRHQFLYLSGSEPLTVDTIEGICIEIPPFRTHITD